MVNLINVNKMNKFFKGYVITFGILFFFGLLLIGWNFYKSKQAESYCLDLKKLISQVESQGISAQTLKIDQELNCQ
jgi:predicted negative regulator of RcsB-dependent stress response